MAKTVGQVNEYSGRIERRAVQQPRGGERLIPWTAGPRNRRQKLARALWG
jgi:hypothetical protein